MKHIILRPAIAMIELIFAIVIMGIVMMSAPMLVSTASTSGYVAMQQEGIQEASAQMNMMLSYPWDEQNANLSLDRIVLRTTTNTFPPVLPVGIPQRRAGTPVSSQRQFIDSAGNPERNATKPINLGIEGTTIDDIDDFIDDSSDLILPENDDVNSNYIQKMGDLVIAKTVNYALDIDAGIYNATDLTFTPFVNTAGATDTTNIKEIQVTLTSAAGQATELDKNITLRAFSCNIGSYALEERTP